MKSLTPTVRQIAVAGTGSAFLAIIIGVAALNSDGPCPASAAPPNKQPAEKMSVVRFTQSGELRQPTGYRKWTYVGTPLTPNDKNDGQAAFPEFHNVYMNPVAFDQYEKTGERFLTARFS